MFFFFSFLKLKLNEFRTLFIQLKLMDQLLFQNYFFLMNQKLLNPQMLEELLEEKNILFITSYLKFEFNPIFLFFNKFILTINNCSLL